MKVSSIAQTNGEAWQKTDQATIAAMNVVFREAYPSYELKDFANPLVEPTNPENGYAYLVYADGECWGQTVLAKQIICRVGGAWTLLPETIDNLHDRIAQNQPGERLLGGIDTAGSPTGNELTGDYYEALTTGVYSHFPGISTISTSAGCKIKKTVNGNWYAGLSSVSMTEFNEKIDGFEERISTIENKLMKQNLNFFYSDGPTAGATIIQNGFQIPVGSTGFNSYRRFRKAVIDTSNYYLGQILKFQFVITISNYTELSTNDVNVILQKQTGATYVGNVSGDFVTKKDTISGTTLIKQCTITHVITQDDINSGYNFVCLSQTKNTRAVTSTVDFILSNVEVLEEIKVIDKIIESEQKIDGFEERISEVESGIYNLNNVNSSFFSGESMNGATVIPNGFQIPVGSTGSTSYFLVKPNSQSFDTNYCKVGQKLIFTVQIRITNYTRLPIINSVLRVRKLQGQTIITNSAIQDSTSYVDVIDGTTLTRTITCTYIVTQTDIDNSYWHCVYWQLQNSAVVSEVVDITTTVFSITYNSLLKTVVNDNTLRLDVVQRKNTFKKITVKSYGTAGVDADFCGNRAIQDAIESIVDALEINQYIIEPEGYFAATQVSDFSVTHGTQKTFIECKDFVHIIASKECVLLGYLPNNLGAGFAYSNYNLIFNNAKAKVKGITTIAENIRYPFHIDGGAVGCKDYEQELENIATWHKGTSGDASSWNSWHPIGLGTSSGQKLNIINAELRGKKHAFYVHNNLLFSDPSKVTLKNSKLFNESTSDTRLMIISSLGSRQRDQIIFEDCTIGNGTIYFDDNPWFPTSLKDQIADHSEFDLLMTNTDPLPIWDGFRSRALKITSKSTGTNSSVVFDESSTAFNLLIGNSNDTLDFINKYNRNQKNGYQYRFGGAGLSGFAIGSLDIAEYVVGSGSKYIGSLGKRLGDCSSVNKTLTVIIDGTTYNIVFNKNYNNTADTVSPAYSNTQIIAEIANVIGSFANIALYNSSADYYPGFANVENLKNGDTSEILAGMGIVRIGLKTIRKALNSDGRIDGICLDDARPGDFMRVMKKGKIWSMVTGFRFTTKEVTNSTRAINAELGISTTQPGYFDIAASPKVLRAIDANILTIL